MSGALDPSRRDVRRAEDLLADAVYARRQAEAKHRRVEYTVSFRGAPTESVTEFARRMASQEALLGLFKEHDVDLELGVEIAPCYDAAYLCEAVTATGWVKR